MWEIELSPEGSGCCNEMGEDHSTGRESMEMTLLKCNQVIDLRVLPGGPLCDGVGGGSRPFPCTKNTFVYYPETDTNKSLFLLERSSVLFSFGMVGEMAVVPPIGKIDDQSDDQPEKEP